MVERQFYWQYHSLKLNYICCNVGLFILLLKNRRESSFSLRARANELSRARSRQGTVTSNYGRYDTTARLLLNLEHLLALFFFGEIPNYYVWPF